MELQYKRALALRFIILAMIIQKQQPEFRVPVMENYKINFKSIEILWLYLINEQTSIDPKVMNYQKL